MPGSTLSVIKGEVLEGNPLSCSIFSERSPLCLWTWPPQEMSAGDLLIDYPFPESFPQLEHNTTEPTLAHDIRKRIGTCINDLIDEGTQRSLNPFVCEWALRELLTNATQYGGVRSPKDSCGVVRLEWAFNDTNRGAELSLGVSHACATLFDPTRYARMGSEVVDEIEEGGLNGHVGTAGLLAFLKDGSSLTYLWRLPEGECIALYTRLGSTPDEGVGTRPIERSVARWDEQGDALPYTLEDFERDVAQGLATDKLTVACAVG